MVARGFDQAPVVDQGRIIGLTRVTLLRAVARVGDAVDSIRPADLVSADAPVSRALSWLRDTPCLFVLDGRRITGFFVQADLNKQPARTYFYLLVASLEAGLAGLVRAWADGDEEKLAAAMPVRVRYRAERASSEARSEDVDADLVAYLLFSDLLRVVERIPELRRALGSSSASHWHDRTSSLVSLRNAVMHPARNLVGRERYRLVRLVELDATLRDLVACIDRVVARSFEAPVSSHGNVGTAVV